MFLFLSKSQQQCFYKIISNIMETKRKIWFKTKEWLLWLMIWVWLIWGWIAVWSYASWPAKNNWWSIVTYDDWKKLRNSRFNGSSPERCDGEYWAAKTINRQNCHWKAWWSIPAIYNSRKWWKHFTSRSWWSNGYCYYRMDKYCL